MRGIVFGLVTATIGTVLGSCSDSMQPTTRSAPNSQKLRDGVLVSGPIHGAQYSLARASVSSTIDSQLVFVSMPPGTLTSGDSVRVSASDRAAATRSELMGDGGFDPLPVYAFSSDSLDVVVFTHGAATQARVGISALRQPSVVRTTPSRGRTDVPLNQGITIVFSQPIDGTTVTPTSVQLSDNGVAVSASLSEDTDQPWLVHVAPTSLLLPNTTYNITIASAIKDVNGLPLSSFSSVEFTTGTSAAALSAITVVAVSTYTFPISSIAQASPGSTSTFSTIELSANGDTLSALSLVGDTLQWSSSDQRVATIDSHGVATAVAAGQATITACVNTICGSGTILVSGDVAGVRPADLGELGGGSSLIFAMSGNWIVGNSRVPVPPGGAVAHHAIVWSPDRGMEDLGTFQGDRESYAEMVSADGMVVGHGSYTSDAEFEYTTWWTWRRASGMQAMPVPGESQTPWTPVAMNSLGEIAFLNNDGGVIGLWSASAGGRVKAAPVVHFYIAGMNVHGQIAIGVTQQPSPERKAAGDGDWSSCTNIAYVWDANSGQVTSTLSPRDPATGQPTSICPVAINDQGVVAGLINQFSNYKAFRWTSGTGFTYLNREGVTTSSEALNNLGEIPVFVGEYTHIGRDSLFQEMASVWMPNDSLVPLASLGGNVTAATSINDLHQVGGYSQVGSTSGPQHAALWDLRSGQSAQRVGTVISDNSKARPRALRAVRASRLDAPGSTHVPISRP
jgi:hypothetical protein